MECPESPPRAPDRRDPPSMCNMSKEVEGSLLSSGEIRGRSVSKMSTQPIVPVMNGNRRIILLSHTHFMIDVNSHRSLIHEKCRGQILGCRMVYQ